MLPDDVTLQLFEAMQDQQITTAEASGMITTIFNSAVGAMVMALGMVMFNRVLKHNPGNPALSPMKPTIYYHATSHENLSKILTEGLHPQERTGDVPDQWGRITKRIYLLEELDESGYYGDVILKVKIPPGVSVKQSMTTEGVYVTKPIPPRYIEMYSPTTLGGGYPGNPGNPDGPTTSEIIARAGLKEYEYRYFPPPEEERKPRVYPYRRTKDIGSYSVVMTRTDDACTIKLYEYLPGWKRKLRATWIGTGKAECDKKFEEVVSVIRQVRFEEKTAMRGMM